MHGARVGVGGRGGGTTRASPKPTPLTSITAFDCGFRCVGEVWRGKLSKCCFTYEATRQLQRRNADGTYAATWDVAYAFCCFGAKVHGTENMNAECTRAEATFSNGTTASKQLATFDSNSVATYDTTLTTTKGQTRQGKTVVDYRHGTRTYLPLGDSSAPFTMSKE